MTNKLLLLLSINLLFAVFASAQFDVAIGSWKSYLPYRQGNYVTQSQERIYYATEFSVMALDKSDFAIQLISTVNGLSNTGIQLIKYNPLSNILIIAYTNGTIDLVKPNGISTLNQIRNFRNIIGQKTINNIFIENDSIVYLAASYGISKLNLLNERFSFSTFTGINVNDVAIYDQQIFCATDEGIYTIAQSNPFPENFSAWQRLDTNNGFPEDYTSKHLAIFQNTLYLDLDNILYKYTPQQLQAIHTEPNHQIAYLSTESAKGLVVGWTLGTQAQGKVLYFNAQDNFTQLPNDCVFNPLYAVEDNQREGFIWFADQKRSFWYLENLQSSNCKSLEINSPYAHHVHEITVEDDALWVAAGGVNSTFSPILRVDGFFRLQENQWTEYNQFVTPQLIGKPLWDFLKVLKHPVSGKIYAAAFVEGLVEWDGTNFVIYDDSNSSLGNAVGDETRTRVSGIAFDKDDNLWISNYLARRPFSVFTKDGQWQSFAVSGPCTEQTQLTQVLIDRNGYKWFVSANSNVGLMVYDTGRDLTSTNDDRCKIFTSANSSLPTNRVNAITMDLDGAVWVATSEGVAVFQCFDPFDSRCDFFLPRTDQDENNLGLLLQSEDVRTIAIDGANRKWFGTTNGIFVQSPDGTKQIARFNKANSPLFDNLITDIEIDPKTGEVFIGTVQGLISYRGEATAGGQVNSASAYAFPNPVRPEYNGTIAIKGLAENADVKITDVTGQLIFQTKALGGQAIWDGNDYNGRRASSGVYLVFATSNNIFSPDAIATKILFLR